MRTIAEQIIDMGYKHARQLPNKHWLAAHEDGPYWSVIYFKDMSEVVVRIKFADEAKAKIVCETWDGRHPLPKQDFVALRAAKHPHRKPPADASAPTAVATRAQPAGGSKDKRWPRLGQRL